ncbi:MAG: type II toxin-antitoxin system RelE/ParE family toxin [Dehalococcoidia bacterium]|nr:type II toxin-antitoxin system RelE/ParE family toxin [Dehalococcoidia bacterium]
MRIEFHPAAQAEVEQAQAWYEERSVLAAAGFLRELSDVLQHAAEAPERHPLGTAGTHRIMLDRFPFTVFYRIQPTLILVVAVAHQKRKPRYWAMR